jgi:hypothetical protein
MITSQCFQCVNELLPRDWVLNDSTNLIPFIAKKGIHADVVTSEAEWINSCAKYNVSWIISGSGTQLTAQSKAFVEAVTAFHNAGKGLAIMAENDPFHAHANLVLRAIIPPNGKPLLGVGVATTSGNYCLQGNDPGGQVMVSGDASQPGQFGSHLLTSGIFQLHEGNTICRPTSMLSLSPIPLPLPQSPFHLAGNVHVHDHGDSKLEQKHRSASSISPAIDMQILGTGSSGAPALMCSDVYGDPASPRGRIVIDCGFTKFAAFFDDESKYVGIKVFPISLTNVNILSV